MSTARQVCRLNHRVPGRLADEHHIACPVDDFDLNAIVVDLLDQWEQSLAGLAGSDGSHVALPRTCTENGTRGRAVSAQPQDGVDRRELDSRDRMRKGNRLG